MTVANLFIPVIKMLILIHTGQDMNISSYWTILVKVFNVT